eukprot:6340746-Pyramimonas_sp.AAC.1
MKELLADVSSEGFLQTPGKWGLPLSEQQREDAKTVERDCGPQAEKKAAELEFWDNIKKGGFEVSTDCRKSPAAGRWQRALTADPEMKKQYNSITGERKCEKS